MNYIASSFSSLLTDLLPGDMSVSNLLNFSPSSSSGNTALAFVVNEENAGFLVKLPLAGLFSGVNFGLECKINFSGPKISCKVDYNGELQIFSVIKDGALWVAK